MPVTIKELNQQIAQLRQLRDDDVKLLVAYRKDVTHAESARLEAINQASTLRKQVDWLQRLVDEQARAITNLTAKK